MRRPRAIGRPGSVYHVISRFVDRQHALGTEEAKRAFHDMMIRQAAFAGVEILTFCLMGNHFHLLISIPETPNLSEGEILRRLKHIWSGKRIRELEEKFVNFREMSVEGERLVERELDRFRKRMYNLSEFVKDLKQRFSRWFNLQNERKGTLFEERFKSVLVEDGEALQTIAAYIDLNPVRAGLVDDPVDYRWSGYARAVGGNNDRRRGLRRVVFDPRDPRLRTSQRLPNWTETAKRYRILLYGQGIERRHADGRVRKRGFSRDESLGAWESGGAVPAAKLLRCKARYFTDSVIYGSKAFIEEQIDRQRDRMGAYPKANETPSGQSVLVRLRGNVTS